MIRTLLVPGLDGSPAPHWQHWWAASDPSALMLDLSDPGRPDATLWETELAGQILIHPHSILVGHSLGAVLIARLLSKWPNLRVRAALLVAPAEPDTSERIRAFGPLPERPLNIPTTLVASRSDPWMSFDRSAGLARSWRSHLVDAGRVGHINVASGFGPWPFGKSLRNALVHRSATVPTQATPLPRHEAHHAERWL